MKKILVSLCALVFSLIVFAPVQKSLARPAASAIHMLTQPDGATFEARLRGDEYFHFTVDKGGKLIQKNKAGVWCYLTRSKNGLAFSGRADRAASTENVSAGIFADSDMKKAYVGLVGGSYASNPQHLCAPVTLEKVRKAQKQRRQKNSVSRQDDSRCQSRKGRSWPPSGPFFPPSERQWTVPCAD